MTKKIYKIPQMRVVEMEPVNLICQSMLGSQNESYDVVDEDVTSVWFN